MPSDYRRVTVSACESTTSRDPQDYPGVQDYPHVGGSPPSRASNWESGSQHKNLLFGTRVERVVRADELAVHIHTTRSGAGKSLGEESTSRCHRSHRSGRPRRMFSSLVAGERRGAAPRPRRAATSSAIGLDVTNASAIRLAVRPLLGTSPRAPRRQPVVRPWCSPRP